MKMPHQKTTVLIENYSSRTEKKEQLKLELNALEEEVLIGPFFGGTMKFYPISGH